MLKRPVRGFPRLPEAEERVSVTGRRKLFFQMHVQIFKLFHANVLLTTLKFDFQTLSALLYYYTMIFFCYQDYFLTEMK